jgi:hypothetical protein
LVHQLSYSLQTLDALSRGTTQRINIFYERAKYLVPWKDSFSLIDSKEYLANAVNFNDFNDFIYKKFLFHL